MHNWYKDAIIYELHVRAFFDSNNDGIGDFKGLTQKLDYLQDLGINTLWLLPFYPSPLRDDGYDISNYLGIHPSYGTLHDFKDFLQKAHQRNIRVITELVINHTSDQHEWFQKSRRAKPGTYWHDFYVWSDHPNRYQDARIIFGDYETSNWAWDPVAKRYYWHRFYSHQPDLNFDNPEVKKAIFKVADFWLAMGVDGMRLDAVPYLFERENTSCENLPETHGFLKELRAYVDSKFPDRLLLAEANQWPEDAVAYFGDDDECQMCFHFPLMPRLFMALKNEDRYSIIDILKQTPEIPENCHWAMFLRNHDELTLEMVTDEERDYMHRVYAANPQARINLGIRRRLAPLLGNDRRQIELLFAILFSLPGAPVIYYGDEIAMGDNIYLGDRNGVRTPFQWSADRNAGFSRSDPQQLYLPINISPEYHYEANNVEIQQQNSNSLLWWLKNLISMRKSHPALNRGKLEILSPENPRTLVFTRQLDDKAYLIVANLSRRVQCVELDLSAYLRRVPVEMSSRVDFPIISNAPYFLTLGPYGIYWFELSDRSTTEPKTLLEQESIAVRQNQNPLEALEETRAYRVLERNLAAFLPKMRWFSAKHKAIYRCIIEDIITLPHIDKSGRCLILIVQVQFGEGDPEHYLVPLAAAQGEQAERIESQHPNFVVGRFDVTMDSPQNGVYYDALLDKEFGSALLDAVFKKKKIASKQGGFSSTLAVPLKKEWLSQNHEPSANSLEQTNSSLIFDREFHLKLFRKLEPGENPDVEIGNFLSHPKPYEHVPKLIASVDYATPQSNYTLAMVQAFVESEASAWDLMQGHLALFAQEALAKAQLGQHPELPASRGFALLDVSTPLSVQELAGPICELARLLGERTGDLHQALARESDNPHFALEGFTPFYLRALYQSLRNTTDRTIKILKSKLTTLDDNARSLGDLVLANLGKIDSLFSLIRLGSSSGMRIRCHGDLHLNQVLFSGKDFYFIDFEGEPSKPLSERKLKRSSLRDVASMLRSFDYVAHHYAMHKIVRDEDRASLEPWLESWVIWVSAEYIKGYVSRAQGSSFFPSSIDEASKLTTAFVLEKALYELHYELANRPDWAIIPLKGIVEQLG